MDTGKEYGKIKGVAHVLALGPFTRLAVKGQQPLRQESSYESLAHYKLVDKKPKHYPDRRIGWTRMDAW